MLWCLQKRYYALSKLLLCFHYAQWISLHLTTGENFFNAMAITWLGWLWCYSTMITKPDSVLSYAESESGCFLDHLRSPTRSNLSKKSIIETPKLPCSVKNPQKHVFAHELYQHALCFKALAQLYVLRLYYAHYASAKTYIVQDWSFPRLCITAVLVLCLWVCHVFSPDFVVCQLIRLSCTPGLFLKVTVTQPSHSSLWNPGPFMS